MSRRWRWRVELGLALVSAVLVVVQAVWPRWVEALLDASPDGGDGSAERWFALVFVAATLVFSLLARRDRRRTVATAA